MAVLGSFARRCVKCDALFLAATEVAQASGTRNKVWEEIVKDLKTGALSSDWYKIVKAEVEKRGLLLEVMTGGKEFVANRKQYGVVFAQFCYHAHCNTLTGSSADLVRLERKFGIMLFLLSAHPEQTRYLFFPFCYHAGDISILANA
jgi:hypothetical protein